MELVIHKLVPTELVIFKLVPMELVFKLVLTSSKHLNSSYI